jgi:hypothetical protein
LSLFADARKRFLKPGGLTVPGRIDLITAPVVPRKCGLGSSVLHASAVAVGEGAVAFVGPTGAGKSSLAASFASRGFSLLSDDFLLLREHANGFLAVPSYPGLRLWPDSADLLAGQGDAWTQVPGSGDKKRLTPRKVAAPTLPRPLLAVVQLTDRTANGGPAVHLTRLARRPGFMAIFQQAFRMERSGRERHLAELDRFARLAESTTLFGLCFPREYERLAEVRSRILVALNDLAGKSRPTTG